MKRCIGLAVLFGLCFAQSFWDQPTTGQGTAQAEAFAVVGKTAKGEVFMITPALYAGVAQFLKSLADRGVQVRVIVQSGGLSVSDGLGLLWGSRVQVRLAGIPTAKDPKALLLVNQQILLAGPALWDARRRGYQWRTFPQGTSAGLLEQLRLLWQGAKSP